MKTVHYPSLTDCPHGWCGRVGGNGFSRKDHLNQHIKQIHAGVLVPGKAKVKVDYKGAEAIAQQPGVSLDSEYQSRNSNGSSSNASSEPPSYLFQSQRISREVEQYPQKLLSAPSKQMAGDVSRIPSMSRREDQHPHKLREHLSGFSQPPSITLPSLTLSNPHMEPLFSNDGPNSMEPTPFAVEQTEIENSPALPSYSSPKLYDGSTFLIAPLPVNSDIREQLVDKKRIQASQEVQKGGSLSFKSIQFPNRQVEDNDPPMQTEQIPVAQGKNFYQGLKLFFKTFEPPLKTGEKRVRWTCACGFSSFDDFQELSPGAVEAYEEYLKTYLGSQQNSMPSTETYLLSNILQMLRLDNTLRYNRNQEQPVLLQHNLHLSTMANGPPPTNVSNNTIFLLLCLPHRRYATKLIQPSLEKIRSDRDFFNLLQSSYVSFRGKYRSFLTLKTLKRIKFVHFEMYKSELVDIRVDKGQQVIPPEGLKNEYHYRPIPATIIPPVGENHMMHLCSHPEDADDSTAVLMDRVPKKLRDRLCVLSGGTNMGWGIYYVEGWHLSIIWLISLLLLLLASLVFLICWAVLQHDVQGASGIATYVLALITLSIGSLQAAFEMELL